MSNTIIRPFLEKLGGTNVNDYVGLEGDIFYDPEVGDLRISDGVTPGGVPITGGGGGSEWVRPADWLTMPEVVETEEKFVGLFAVYDTPANFIAVYFEGDYTVDWGDGNVEDFNSGDTAQHDYNWADIDSGTLTTEGYRQVLVTVTPQSGQQLTLMDLTVRHDNYYQLYASTPWLDLKVSMPNADSGGSLRFCGYQFGINNNGYLFDVQRIHIVHSGGMTDFTECFYNSSSLGSVIIDNCPNADIFYYLFDSCYALTSVSLPDTSSVTNMSFMFANCYALTSVSLPDTSSVTNMGYMFGSCHALTSVSLPDTSSVTDMSSMFYDCTTLTSVPLPDTSSVTNMSGMFSYCPALTSVSLPDTSSVTDMSSMFSGCPNLQIVSMPGTSVNIDFSNCLLSKDEIVNIFNDLATVVSATINVANNYGTGDLSAGDIQIATDKNWTVNT